MRAAALGVVLLLVTSIPAQFAAADTSAPALRARFELKHADGRTEHLELLRDKDRVEHHFVERGYTESWQRDARGELEHVRAFPRDGKSVHYTAGDLRTIQLAPDWHALETLLAQKELTSLRQVGTKRGLQNRLARVLTGTLRGQPAKVSWIDEVALPAQLALGAGTAKVVISLVSITSCEQAACTPVDTSALRSLEFADLGDMEYDPFVRRYLARESHGRH